ncbi:MAG: general secretion pathway protein GspB [Geobacteraceae bacterium]|nr:general secretion pathway protein GspB [Geobacteraceae bacterium]
MSSILKALKKVENDKRICRPDQFGIDARILQDGSPARFTRISASLIAAALFLCGSGATYFFMRHDTTHLIPQTPPPRSVSVPLVPVSDVVQPGLGSRLVSSSPARRSSAKPASVVGAQARTTGAAVKLSRPTLPERQTDRAAASVSRPVTAPIATVSAVRNMPHLTVNGIAYQEGGSDNLAVINGITVSNGAVIEGVKVEDIQKDRVQFSHDGEKFEIILNKSNR